MDERDLETEEATVRLEVDQLDALVREAPELAVEVGDLVGDVVHAGAALGEEPAHVRVVAERSQELDATIAEPHRGSLDALVGHRLALLELGAEDTLVRADGLVEVDDCDPQMMDPLRLHREVDAND
jgi:hypothetical protein